ncbi:MAG: DUF1552 domain-containing protein [Planctomycetes bacterium]|nr:DUF1552 domain-containing protein [Planctomycetota bacterium]
MRKPLSRRTLLRGLGTAMALPALEAMSPTTVFGATRTPSVKAPTRAVWIYVPNGVHMPDWRPTSLGKSYELPWILKPLAKHKRHLSVLMGLDQQKARANGDGPGDHARASAVFLTGVQPLKTDGAVKLAKSADQVAADAIGAETPFRSLVVGCEGARVSGQCDSGYSCAYSGHISWLSEKTPAGKVRNPRLVFERLFRGGGKVETAAALAVREERRLSIIDYVLADARRLRRKLGKADKDKLEEYFDGIRELERRLEFSQEKRAQEVPLSRAPEGIPDDHAEHQRLLYDVIALAFETDSTRLATFLVGNEGSNRAHKEVGVTQGHHSLSHHGKDPVKQADIRKINRAHVEQLAYFLDRLSSITEGGETLLDSSMIVYGSGIADGNSHAHHDLPILLAGRGGGIKTGEAVRYPEKTPMNDLHLAMLERLGAPATSLGDGRAPLF